MAARSCPRLRGGNAISLAIGLVGCASPAAPPARAQTQTERIARRLEQRIPPLLREAGVPGLSIALLRDGELVWHRGFGVKNARTGEPVTDGTVFEAASLSKPVFAYAVLRLVDRGELDLDRPLTQYLPGRYDVGDDPRLDRITARRVLSHTTGLPNWRPRGGPLLIHFTPGERFSYSGEGFVYLSKVIEHVTGEALDDFMRRIVFEPLGMTSSSYVWQESYEARMTSVHDSKGDPAELDRMARSSGNVAASLLTTAEDYGRFVAAVSKGTGLRTQSWKSMLTPQVNVRAGGPQSIDRPHARPVPEIAWGLGWGLQTTRDGLSFWHWGDNDNSKAYVVVAAGRGTGVVFFANSASGLSIAREIVGEAVGGGGGDQPALAWLNYPSYRSARMTLLRNMAARGAPAALRAYRAWRTGRSAGELIDEGQMNGLGYEVLYSWKREEDAIEVFRLNAEDHPGSTNVYDSLGEAYAVHGDRALAIESYERSVDLNPANANAIEALKKLRESR